MLYDALLQLIFLGLGAHYIVVSDASPRSKIFVGVLLAVALLFGRWLPWFVLLAIQVGLSLYVLMVYRLGELSAE
jgi:hypothetical protein